MKTTKSLEILAEELNGQSHYDLAKAVQAAGWIVDADTEDNERSVVRGEDDEIVAEILGDETAELEIA